MRSALNAAAAALVAGAAAPASAQILGAGGSWGGAYLGVSPGIKLGDATWTATQLNGGGAGGTPFTAVDGSSPRTYSLTAARLGGFAGVNWQFGPWVAGPEAGFAWSDEKKTRALFPGCGLGCSGFFPDPGPNDTTSVRLQWDATIGGRAGYLVAPQRLLYGTAGLALQQVETTGACMNPTLNSQYCFGPGPQSPIRHGLTLVGFTVGSGLETQLAANWFARGEYRFSYFPEVSDTMAFLPSQTGLSNTYRYRLSAQTHILSVGLGYKF
jgi:outer membrane immunogenic protein